MFALFLASILPLGFFDCFHEKAHADRANFLNEIELVFRCVYRTRPGDMVIRFETRLPLVIVGIKQKFLDIIAAGFLAERLCEVCTHFQ